MSDIHRLGVDIAKNSFFIHAVDSNEKTVWKGEYRRKNWVAAVVKRVPTTAVIGIEACGAAHYWARTLQSYGYTVKLIAPQFVKPYVKSNKNDALDAEAICEALGRPNMRFVTIKTVSQQDTQALHRVREDLMKQRTAKVNQIRGLVGEYGLVAPVGICAIKKSIPMWLEDADNNLTSDFRYMLSLLQEDLELLNNRIITITDLIKAQLLESSEAKQLLKVAGIGPIVCSALVTSLGDGKSFRKGRDFAASLGLVPRQHSSGGKNTLLGISKRGNAYLRKLLVHGARSAYRVSHKKNDKLSCWIQHLLKTKHPNTVVVALANKLARIAWAIVSKGHDYNEQLAAG